MLMTVAATFLGLYRKKKISKARLILERDI